jgi:hypothetical protein
MSLIISGGYTIGPNVSLISNPPPIPPIVTNGLKLHLDSRNPTSWPGSGTTWYDLSGNGKNATFYANPSALGNSSSQVIDGTAIDGSTLISSGDLYFNGNAGHYNYAAGPNLSNNLLTWTISAWFKVESFVGGLPSILSGIFCGSSTPVKEDSVNFAMAFYNGAGNDGKIYGGFYQPGAWEIVSLGFAPTLGTWYNGVVTYDGSTINFYINNSLIATASGVYSTTLNSDVGYRVGRRWDGAETLDGYIPVAMVYNRVLTTDELTQNFNYYRTQYGV